MATYTHTKVDYINVLDPVAPRYWVSPVESNFDSSQWSAESGGSPGASVPGALNAIIFDGNGVGNCLFNAPVNIRGITEGPGYTGSLIQGSFPITIGDASFLSGNFIGTNYPVTILGNLIFSEGFSWQGSDSTISALGDVYVNQGFTADQNRAVTFLGLNKQNLHCNGGFLPAVHVDKSSSNQVKAFGEYPIYVNGDFIVFDGTFNTNGHDLNMTAVPSVPVPPVPVPDSTLVDFTWGIVPNAPFITSLSATAFNRTSLFWGSTPASGWKVERSIDNTAYTQIADTTNQFYYDKGLNSGTTYYYRVKGYGPIGDSAPSASWNVSTWPTDIIWTFSTDVAHQVSFSSNNGGPGSSYNWNFGDSSTGTGQNISHVFPDNTNYTVNLYVSNSDGTAIETRDVTVESVWVLKAPAYINPDHPTWVTDIYDIKVFNNEIYAAGHNHQGIGWNAYQTVGLLLKWDGTGSWIKLAQDSVPGGFSSDLNSLAVYQNELYIGNNYGQLLKYVDTSNLEVVAGIGNYWDTIKDLCVYNDILYYYNWDTPQRFFYYNANTDTSGFVADQTGVIGVAALSDGLYCVNQSWHLKKYDGTSSFNTVAMVPGLGANHMSSDSSSKIAVAENFTYPVVYTWTLGDASFVNTNRPGITGANTLYYSENILYAAAEHLTKFVDGTWTRLIGVAPPNSIKRLCAFNGGLYGLNGTPGGDVLYQKET